MGLIAPVPIHDIRVTLDIYIIFMYKISSDWFYGMQLSKQLSTVIWYGSNESMLSTNTTIDIKANHLHTCYTHNTLFNSL